VTSAEPNIAEQQVVVLERQPYWQPELERQFLQQELIVRGCRSVEDLDDLTRTAGATIVVVDLEVDPPSVLRWLARQLMAGPDTPTLVVLSENLKLLHWHVRELGAVAVVSEFHTGACLARLCRKTLDAVGDT
jgi:hypothetical protein